MDDPTSEEIANLLMGEAPSLTRLEVAEQSGVHLEVARELWRLLGFPQVEDDDVVFSASDVEALKLTQELIDLGIIAPDFQAALTRTVGRSFARLAEWQVGLLSQITLDDFGGLPKVTEEALPRMEKLQDYIWRRHLASAAAMQLGGAVQVDEATRLAVCFVDIVGYTSRSKELTEAELIEWLEEFESEVVGVVVDHGGQVIKTIGDEVMYVVSDPRAGIEIGLILTARGQDPDDSFPAVRVGVAFGDVVRRLGDVFGPTVNIGSRLTSIARPGTVLVNSGVHELLCVDHAPEATQAKDLRFKRLRRTSVKGYSRLESWTARRAD